MLPQKPAERGVAPMDHRMHDIHDVRGTQDTDDKDDGAVMPAWKHWGLMALCCLPMLAIAVLFIAGLWR